MAKIQRDVAIANVVAGSQNPNRTGSANAYINVIITGGVVFPVKLKLQSAYATLPKIERNYQLPAASIYQISEPDGPGLGQMTHSGSRRALSAPKVPQYSDQTRFDGIALKRSSIYRKDEFVPVPSKLDQYINDIVVYRGQMVQMVPLSPNNYPKTR